MGYQNKELTYKVSKSLITECVEEETVLFDPTFKAFYENPKGVKTDKDAKILGIGLETQAATFLTPLIISLVTWLFEIIVDEFKNSAEPYIRDKSKELVDKLFGQETVSKEILEQLDVDALNQRILLKAEDLGISHDKAILISDELSKFLKQQ